MSIHEERWKNIYLNRQYETYYPFDQVVSFMFRHHPRDKPRDQTKVLEVGCGLGNNLRFLAKAGFSTSGIDISPDAIERAAEMLHGEGLQADLQCCSCAALPFADATFDMVVDRGTFTVLPDEVFAEALDEVRRVLAPSGHFLFTPYADSHSSNGIANPVVDGLVEDIVDGSLSVRQRGVRFLSFNNIRELFRSGWNMKSVKLHQSTEMLTPMRQVDATWHVVLQKV